MTYDDDVVRLQFVVGPVTIRCKQLGIEWPPPEYIHVTADRIAGLTPEEFERLPKKEREIGVLARVSMSDFSDDERASMAHIIRGAEYQYLAEIEKEGRR